MACSVFFTKDRLARGIKDIRDQKFSACSPAETCVLRARLVETEDCHNARAC